MGKRSSGEGTIFKRRDGRFDVALWVDSPTGTRKRLRATKTSRKEADRQLTEWKKERDEGTDLVSMAESNRLTVETFFKTWIQSARGTIGDKAWRDYESKVRIHIIPAIGEVKLRNLTTRHLEALYDQKVREGYGRQTLSYIDVTMSKALNRACAWDLLSRNVASFAKVPRVPEGQKKRQIRSKDDRLTLTTADVGRFFEVIRGDRLEALYLIAVTTGLRRGEILRLRWADVDLDSGAATIWKSKTSSSRRSVVLLPQVVAALRRRQTEQKEEKLKAGLAYVENDLIFSTRFGKAQHGDSLRDNGLRPMLAKAGLPALTFHELRHTTASLLPDLDVNPQKAKAYLGHASITQTVDTYTHLPSESVREVAAKVGERLFPEPVDGKRNGKTMRKAEDIEAEIQRLQEELKRARQDSNLRPSDS